jgi:hypothetical protein
MFTIAIEFKFRGESARVPLKKHRCTYARYYPGHAPMTRISHSNRTHVYFEISEIDVFTKRPLEGKTNLVNIRDAWRPLKVIFCHSRVYLRRAVIRSSFIRCGSKAQCDTRPQSPDIGSLIVRKLERSGVNGMRNTDYKTTWLTRSTMQTNGRTDGRPHPP